MDDCISLFQLLFIYNIYNNININIKNNINNNNNNLQFKWKSESATDYWATTSYIMKFYVITLYVSEVITFYYILRRNKTYLRKGMEI